MCLPAGGVGRVEEERFEVHNTHGRQPPVCVDVQWNIEQNGTSNITIGAMSSQDFTSLLKEALPTMHHAHTLRTRCCVHTSTRCA